MTAPQAVLFDLDNTLILEDESTFRAIRSAAVSAGLRPDAMATAVAETADALWQRSPVLEYGETFGIWWGEALWGEFRGDDAGARSLRAFVPGFRDAVWRGALERVGEASALAEQLKQGFIADRRSRETIDPEAEPVLADLARDHRLALVTNGAADVQREKLSRTPFARYFAAVVISAEAGFGKPDPRLFAAALRALDATADAATMVGDSLARDVAGARGAGLRAIWLDRKLWKEEPVRPDARIERLSDLRAALDGLERRPASPAASP